MKQIHDGLHSTGINAWASEKARLQRLWIGNDRCGDGNPVGCHTRTRPAHDPHDIRHLLSRQAYTVIEFVIVVVVLAVLLGLLLPALQNAQESARRMQCQNNLKLLALGCLNHEQATVYLPTGGWGVAWTGDADLGFG
jgi:hypothetical protein